MNEKTFTARQSCRRYLPDPVPRELVDSLIDAARLAPSACNSQPWSFLVLDSEPLRTSAAEAAFSGIYHINAFAKQAPVLIVVITGRSTYAARWGGQFRGVQYNLIDIGIAGAFLDLAAAQAGLGSCWLGWFNEKGLKKVLGLPRSARVDIVFSVGYPADDRLRQKSRKTLEEVRKYL